MLIEADVEREHVRVPFNRHIDMEFVSDRYEHCHAANLSLNGMFINGDFKKHKGKLCNIELVQSRFPTELSLHALAKVVRQDENGIAVTFSSMTYESYIYLQTLLYEAQDNITIKQMLKEDCPFELTDVPPLADETFQ